MVSGLGLCFISKVVYILYTYIGYLWLTPLVTSPPPLLPSLPLLLYLVFVNEIMIFQKSFHFSYRYLAREKISSQFKIVCTPSKKPLVSLLKEYVDNQTYIIPL